MIFHLREERAKRKLHAQDRISTQKELLVTRSPPMLQRPAAPGAFQGPPPCPDGTLRTWWREVQSIRQ